MKSRDEGNRDEQDVQGDAALKIITGTLGRPTAAAGIAEQKHGKAVRRYLRWAATGVLLILVCAAGIHWGQRHPQQINVPSPRNESNVVAVEPVVDKVQPIAEQNLSAAGLIKAQQISTVSAEITGTVAKIYVKRGQFIKQGEPVAELDTAYQQNAVDEATTKLHSAQNDLLRQQNLLPLMKARYERQMKLSLTHMTSVQEVDNARIDWINTASEVHSMDLQVQDAKNVLARNQINLSKAIIRAPFDGMVVSLDAALGEIVSPVSSADSYARTGIATIVSTSPFHADVWVPESFLSRVMTGQAVTVSPDGLNNVTVPGTVSFISPVVDESRAAVLIQIELEKGPRELKHNMSVHVDFQRTELPGKEGKSV